MMKITSGRKWREYLTRDDVPPEILASDFDWTDETDGFLRYHGTWYHRSQFMRFGYPGPFGQTVDGWHGYHADGFSSGVVIKVHDDGERYQIGRCCVVSDAAAE